MQATCAIIYIVRVHDSHGVMRRIFFPALPDSLCRYKYFLSGWLLVLTMLVPARGSAQTEGLVIPDTIFAGTVRVDKCDSVTFPIFNDGDQPVRIDGITLSSTVRIFSLSSRTATVVPRIDPGNSHFVTLRFCPEETGCFSDSLVVSGGVVGGSETENFRIGLGGCAGIPQGEVDGNELIFPTTRVDTCSSLQLKVINRGTFPLTVSEFRFADGKVFSSPDAALLPFSLLPDEERRVRIDFCPTERKEATDVLTIIDDGEIPIDPVILRGTGLKSRFGLPAIIDFGDVPVGTRKDTVLTVRNTDDIAPLLILRSVLDEGMNAYTIEEITPADPRSVLPDGMVSLSLSFRPTETGSVQGKVVLEDDQVISAETLLRGNGVVPAVRLDTVSGMAGEFVRLTLSVDRVGDLTPQIGRYRFVFSIPPLALFPRELSGSPATMAYEADGRLVVEGDHGGNSAPDGKLFTLTFRGLSTGDPVNPVRIEEAEWTDFGSLPLPIAGHGLVRLEGCDVGRSVGVIGKPVSLKVFPNPAAEELVVSCSTPPQSLPMLTLYTTSAEEVRRYSLPVDTNEESYRLSLSGLHPGTYLLELQAGGGRDVEVIVVK